MWGAGAYGCPSDIDAILFFFYWAIAPTDLTSRSGSRLAALLALVGISMFRS